MWRSFRGYYWISAHEIDKETFSSSCQLLGRWRVSYLPLVIEVIINSLLIVLTCLILFEQNPFLPSLWMIESRGSSNLISSNSIRGIIFWRQLNLNRVSVILFMTNIHLCLSRSMMSKYGLKSVFPVEDISVMGAWELLPHLYKIKVSSERLCLH